MIIFILFLQLVSAKTLTTVQPEQFYVGAKWTWAYAERDKQSGQWKAPYLYEQYTVISAQGTTVTIEMASAPQAPVTSPAHHKFTADVAKCLAAYQDYKKKKPWSIVFYTKSLGPQWELVSASHPPLAFLEKFNCAREIDDPAILESEYVQDAGPWAGVAFHKNFDVNYRFDLLMEPQ